MTNNTVKENIIGFSRLILAVDFIFCMAYIFNIDRLSINMKDIGWGFLVASVFLFFGYLIKDKPEWIFKFFRENNEDGFDFLYILGKLVIILLVIGCILSAFIIIDYEFINEGIDFFGIDSGYHVPKPKFLVKFSFIITSAILTYCYSNCKEES
nr:hypothetical protein [uncultured Haemophilus sp.]